MTRRSMDIFYIWQKINLRRFSFQTWKAKWTEVLGRKSDKFVDFTRLLSRASGCALRCWAASAFQIPRWTGRDLACGRNPCAPCDHLFVLTACSGDNAVDSRSTLGNGGRALATGIPYAPARHRQDDNHAAEKRCGAGLFADEKENPQRIENRLQRGQQR